MLKKGDIVVMHTCIEAKNPENDGKLWICRTDEKEVKWTTPNVVWLDGYAGAFSVEFLQRVDVSPYTEEHNSLLKEIEFWKDIAESCECNN